MADGFCIGRFNQPQIKKKNPESSKTQNLSFPHASNYLQSITLYL